MSEEELQWLKEISTTTGISYSGDRTITTDFANELIDYIKQLEQENKAFKNAIMTDHHKIHELVDIIEEVREYVNYLHNNCKYRLNDGHLRKLKKILNKAGD